MKYMYRLTHTWKCNVIVSLKVSIPINAKLPQVTLTLFHNQKMKYCWRSKWRRYAFCDVGGRGVGGQTTSQLQLCLWFKLCFFTFRDLTAELPFILMHPKPEEDAPSPSTPSTVKEFPGKESGDNVPVDRNLIQLDS